VKYTVGIERQALRELSDLPENVRERVRSCLRVLADDARPITSRRLRGTLRHLHKLRVGAYRVVYSVDDEEAEVIIWGVGHRSRVYDVLLRRL